MHSTLARAGGQSVRSVLPKSKIWGAEDILFASICSDSRRCKPGDLFVALLGSERDGHDYYEEAIANGAVAVVCERPLPVGIPQCLVKDSRVAYGRLCQELAGNPCQEMRVIGVTGTNGKTTVSMLLASILKAADLTPGIMGTLGHSDAMKIAVAKRTTPKAHELATWLGKMRDNGCDHAVIELTSKALARRQAAGMQLDVAVLTNIRGGHLDEHNTVMNYRRAKGRIFDLLRPGGVAIINADDPASKLYLSKLTCPVMTVGMHTPAEVTAEVIERHRSEQTFLLTAGQDTVAVQTRMIGDHHVYNCLSAAAVGLVYGFDLATIACGLQDVDHVPGRLERIEAGQPFGVFVDYAHTPDALATSLKALRQVTQGHVWCVYGASDRHAESDLPTIGRILERGTYKSVITSDLNCKDTALEVAHQVIDGYDNPATAHVYPDRAEAIAWVLEQAREGDCVIIAGSGSEDATRGATTRDYDEDRAIARGWLFAQNESEVPSWEA